LGISLYLLFSLPLLTSCVIESCLIKTTYFLIPKYVSFITGKSEIGDRTWWLKPAILVIQDNHVLKASPEEKTIRPHLNQGLDTVVHACHPSYGRKHKWGDYPSIKLHPVSKIASIKRTDGVARVEEHLLSSMRP
jgi:hypothetical protein